MGHRESLTLVRLGGHLPNESHVPFLPLGLGEYEEWAWGGRTSGQRGVFSSLKNFNLLGTCHPFLLSYFSLWNSNVYSMPTRYVFWKHITCLVSWVHSWRAICLYMRRT